MTYANIQLFMEKLKQLINCIDNRLINNFEIRREKRQFQFLNEDLGSIIQALSIDEHQNLQDHEKLNDLRKRFFDAAEEAQYIVDQFLSGVQKRRLSVVCLVLSWVHIRTNRSLIASREFKRSLDLVRKSFKSIEEDFISMRMDNTKVDSSRRTERTLNQSAAAKAKKIVDEIIVGFDDEAKLIKDKLMEDGRKLDVISIVGMGGIGKTTLATKVFNDGYVKYHFHVRVWVTVSQSYNKRDVLIQILESISGQLDLGVASDSHLCELVHKKLMGKRYLIVIDDIWHVETWDTLKVFFPRDNNGSRILLTSRLTDVAKHATLDGLIHHLGYLSKEKGWELLCKKVFHGNECPEWSIKPEMQIVENCQGLPLALVVVAGVLEKEAWSEEFWVQIGDKHSSYVVGDQNGSIMETLGLSYNHLPLHLRECFLYLGGFPEDYKFNVKWLIWLWVAEGFIQADGNRSLEDIAEGYLTDLIERSLVIVAHRSKYNSGVVKAFKLHDLVRELCLKKSQEEGFILQTKWQTSSSSHFSNVTAPAVVRMFIDEAPNIQGFPYSSPQNLRSILCFSRLRSLSAGIANIYCSFVLLRVLDLHDCSLKYLPKDMELLVHLRYLAIQTEIGDFPSSICKLWGLQTLIYVTGHGPVVLPSNISGLINLRHLLSYHPSLKYLAKRFFILHSIEKPMNLQTFSNVELGDGVDIQTCFPYIKELGCFFNKKTEFKSLTCLGKLRLTGNFEMEHMITLPVTLKTLTMGCCGLAWSEMSIIQSLPNLQILKLHYDAFVGSCWNCTDEFPQLKFLIFSFLDIKHWKVDSTSFPCLKQLEICSCRYLEAIPLEIGDIPTLELIQISYCMPSVGESVRRIQNEQHDFGNYNLKVEVLYEVDKKNI